MRRHRSGVSRRGPRADRRPVGTRSRLLRLAALLRAQEGVALATALLVLAMLTAAGVSAVVSTSANSRDASSSKQRSASHALAEAGIAEAMSVLSDPDNNALDPALLSERTSTYPTGSVTWSGELDHATATWTITSTAVVANPTGPDAAPIERTVLAEVEVNPNYTLPANNPVWNYIYATRTGDPDGCDMEIENSGTVASPLYVDGNLCIGQTTAITRGPLVVKGSLTLENPQNRVGSASDPISEAHIGGGCRYKNQPHHDPCQGAPDNVFAQVLTSTPPPVEWPEPDWDAWYLNANPGPYFPCATVSGTPPTFDNDQGSEPDATRRNGSVSDVFHLTPAASYTCQTAGGELSWDAATRTLTALGTIYIDGSVKVENGAVNNYDGQATLYLSGTFLAKNSSLCAVAGSDGCDVESWNPNSELLIVVADGEGGQVPEDTGIQILSADFQGGLLATHAIEVATTSTSDGPLLGDTIILGQSFESSFPFITILPAGAPSNPVVYAQPGAPKIYG